MKAGTPGPEHDKLKAMAGTYEAKVMMWMDPKMPPMEMVGKAENKMILGGRYLMLSRQDQENIWLLASNDLHEWNEGQKIVVNGEALISGRSGFKSPLPEYAPPIDSLNVMKMDWARISTADMSKARAEWVGMFNP